MKGHAVPVSYLVALGAALKQSVLCLLAVPWQYSTYTALECCAALQTQSCVFNRCVESMTGAEFLTRELCALEVLDTKSKCNSSRALTGSCNLPFSGYRYAEPTLPSN